MNEQTNGSRKDPQFSYPQPTVISDRPAEDPSSSPAAPLFSSFQFTNIGTSSAPESRPLTTGMSLAHRLGIAPAPSLLDRLQMADPEPSPEASIPVKEAPAIVAAPAAANVKPQLKANNTPKDLNPSVSSQPPKASSSTTNGVVNGVNAKAPVSSNNTPLNGASGATSSATPKRPSPNATASSASNPAPAIASSVQRPPAPAPTHASSNGMAQVQAATPASAPLTPSVAAFNPQPPYDNLIAAAAEEKNAWAERVAAHRAREERRLKEEEERRREEQQRLEYQDRLDKEIQDLNDAIAAQENGIKRLKELLEIKQEARLVVAEPLAPMPPSQSSTSGASVSSVSGTPPVSEDPLSQEELIRSDAPRRDAIPPAAPGVPVVPAQQSSTVPSASSVSVPMEDARPAPNSTTSQRPPITPSLSTSSTATLAVPAAQTTGQGTSSNGSQNQGRRSRAPNPPAVKAEPSEPTLTIPGVSTFLSGLSRPPIVPRPSQVLQAPPPPVKREVVRPPPPPSNTTVVPNQSPAQVNNQEEKKPVVAPATARKPSIPQMATSSGSDVKKQEQKLERHIQPSLASPPNPAPLPRQAVAPVVASPVVPSISGTRPKTPATSVSTPLQHSLQNRTSNAYLPSQGASSMPQVVPASSTHVTNGSTVTEHNGAKRFPQDYPESFRPQHAQTTTVHDDDWPPPFGSVRNVHREGGWAVTDVMNNGTTNPNSTPQINQAASSSAPANAHPPIVSMVADPPERRGNWPYSRSITPPEYQPPEYQPPRTPPMDPSSPMVRAGEPSTPGSESRSTVSGLPARPPPLNLGKRPRPASPNRDNRRRRVNRQEYDSYRPLPTRQPPEYEDLPPRRPQSPDRQGYYPRENDYYPPPRGRTPPLPPYYERDNRSQSPPARYGQRRSSEGGSPPGSARGGANRGRGRGRGRGRSRGEDLRESNEASGSTRASLQDRLALNDESQDRRPNGENHHPSSNQNGASRGRGNSSRGSNSNRRGRGFQYNQGIPVPAGEDAVPPRLAEPPQVLPAGHHNHRGQHPNPSLLNRMNRSQ
ncbi:hypothetical protein SISSUDRAFT_426575 [Sistotremastrum suecicum HHB10207 ss-3]|uniref:Uncharacterized protein n=1 Tax=Sistotremastrum suecicum HHB10207 ss-3 TaxID=1314776 RepID=A0A166FKZ1_9AGAM|nr:hypothetical protein SISSUDRAFT_426575 [Sistotremastrum suecicum HHB10207 ss-3]